MRRGSITPEMARAAYLREGTYAAAGASLGISGARVHAILTKDGSIVPRPKGDAVLNALLERIVGMVTMVERGPTAVQLAEATGVTPRAVRFQITRLRKANLVFQDADGGVLPTAAARERIQAARPPKGP